MRRLFESAAAHNIEWSWNHGRFFDFWSAVHLLSGFLLGTVTFVFDLSFSSTIVVVAGIATLYEGTEILLNVSEDAENVLTDIIVTTIGGVLAWYVGYFVQPNIGTIVLILISVGVLDILLFSLGWRNFLKKKLYGK